MQGGKTIGHGWLTLALVPRLASTLYRVKHRSRGINYGANRVRFTGMVPAGSKIRLRLTVKAVEPGSVALFKLPLQFFTPGGFPTCAANLHTHKVSCQGLVPGDSYRVADGTSKHATAKANGKGTISVGLAVKGGQVVTLANGAPVLTALHMAHPRVTVSGGTLPGGRCQQGEYFCAPLSKATTNKSAGSLAGGEDLAPMSADRVA